jgi:hypothetical protein
VQTVRVIRGLADVKREPFAIDKESQLLFGELFDVEQFDGDWAFGRCSHDGFVGCVNRELIDQSLVRTTHSVRVFWAPVLRQPFLRFAPHDYLTLGSQLSVTGQHDQFYRLAEKAWVYKAHVADGPLYDPDYIGLAERLVGVPFVWGGRSTCGFDCTGIIQFVLGLAGIAVPRDVPEQATLGEAVDNPRRGDLFFLERRGSFFHAGLFTSETDVVNVGYRFAGVGVQKFSEIYELYRLTEEVNGTLDQLRVHIRRIEKPLAM